MPRGIQWLPCWCSAGILPSEKRQSLRWCSGRWHQVWQCGGVLFLIAKMSQDPVDDVLILNATVRRSDDDFDGPTAATTKFNIDADGRPIDTRLSRWAQDIATCRSAGLVRALVQEWTDMKCTVTLANSAR